MPSEVYLKSGEAVAMVKRFELDYSLQSLRLQPFAWKNPKDKHWYFKRDELIQFLKIRKGTSKWKIIPFPKDKNRVRMWRIIAMNRLRVAIYQNKDVIHHEDYSTFLELLDRKPGRISNKKGYKNEN